MVVMDSRHPEHLVAARSGSPLVIGLGIGENFLASDQLALLSVTRRFIFLEEGDIAEITRRTVDIYDTHGNKAKREIHESNLENDAAEKGKFVILCRKKFTNSQLHLLIQWKGVLITKM